MENETDFSRFACFVRVDESAFDESKTIFSIIRHADKTNTYRINDAITIEQARAVIASISFGELSLPDNSTIEEAEVLIDTLLKERYPGIKEVV